MSYFVVCSFDLKNATRDNYANAYADLANIGLKRQLVSSEGSEVTLPTTLTGGEFTGASSADVCRDVSNAVQAAFKSRRFTSEIFISVGGDWAWERKADRQG
jgi:hypothetical protein